MGGKETVIVRCILAIGKLIRSQGPAQMIAPPGSHVDGPTNLLVLNVASGKREDLGAEAQLAQFAGDRISRELLIVSINCFLIPFEQFRLSDAPIGKSRCPAGVYQGECDADYQQLLELLDGAVAQMWARPRRDLKGF